MLVVMPVGNGELLGRLDGAWLALTHRIISSRPVSIRIGRSALKPSTLKSPDKPRLPIGCIQSSLEAFRLSATNANPPRVERGQADIDPLSADDVAPAQVRALVGQMKERIPGWPTISQSVDGKADAEHAAIETRRLVNREDFDLGDRVIARAVPCRRDAERDRHFNPLAPVDIAATGVPELDVLRRIETLVTRAERVPGHQDAYRSCIDEKRVRRPVAQGCAYPKPRCQARVRSERNMVADGICPVHGSLPCWPWQLVDCAEKTSRFPRRYPCRPIFPLDVIITYVPNACDDSGCSTASGTPTIPAQRIAKVRNSARILASARHSRDTVFHHS